MDGHGNRRQEAQLAKSARITGTAKHKAAPPAKAPKDTTGSGTKESPSIDTQTRILNAAEELFAMRGYDGASVRDIMALADAKLGLMSYYFKSKEDLLEAVLQRRTAYIYTARKAALADTLQAPHGLIEILDACFRIYYTLYFDEDRGWRCHFRLIAQLNQMERWTPLLAKHHNEMSNKCIDAIMALVEGADRTRIIHLWIYTVSSQLNLFAGTGRTETYKVGTTKSRSLEQTYQDLLAFCAGGMSAALGLDIRPAAKLKPKRISRKAASRRDSIESLPGVLGS